MALLVDAKLANGPSYEAQMVTVNVSLPDTLKDWVESEIEAGRYTDAGDYVRALIRRDQERNDALIEALELGSASGVTDYSMDDVWSSAKSRVSYNSL